jgi:hypothetical protein
MIEPSGGHVQRTASTVVRQPVRQFGRELPLCLNVFGDVESQKACARVIRPPNEIVILDLEVIAQAVQFLEGALPERYRPD